MNACSIGKLAVQEVQKVQQGFDRAPASCIGRLSRLDEMVLIWLLHGRPVIALTETVAAILAPSGATLVYGRQNQPARGRIGDSVDDISGARA
jgi:hypothetical protein